MIILTLLVIVVLIIIHIFIASWFEEIAELKGYDSKELKIWRKCFWTGLPGWLYTVALPNKKDVENYDTIFNNDEENDDEDDE